MTEMFCMDMYLYYLLGMYMLYQGGLDGRFQIGARCHPTQRGGQGAEAGSWLAYSPETGRRPCRPCTGWGLPLLSAESGTVYYLSYYPFILILFIPYSFILNSAQPVESWLLLSSSVSGDMAVKRARVLYHF